MGKTTPYTAIVIAGGLSSRMGGFKPLLDIGGKPALFRLLDTIRQVSATGPIVVVTGHGHELLEPALRHYSDTNDEHRLNTIYNADYERGMFSSVQAGIRWTKGWTKGDGSCVPPARETKGDGSCVPPARDECAAALLFPADVPLVSADTIEGLIRAWENALALAGETKRPGFAVPVFGGRNGHPLLIPRGYYNEILGYGGEGGLKAIRGRYDPDMIRYETDDAGCVLDMDTPEDYERILKYDGQYKFKNSTGRT